MICEIYNICLSLRLRQIIDLQTLTNHDILLKLLLSPEKKNYFENSCNCHTPILLSALFALGKSQFFFPRAQNCTRNIFGAKHRYTTLWWVNKHTIGCCSVLWIVTLQAHTMQNYVTRNTMESFFKTEQT